MFHHIFPVELICIEFQHLFLSAVNRFNLTDVIVGMSNNLLYAIQIAHCGHREPDPILGTFDSLRQWDLLNASVLIFGHNMHCIEVLRQFCRGNSTCQSES